MSLANEYVIPKFVSASSPLGLRRAMLLNNLRNATQYKYFQILKDGKKWIAWYYDREEEPTEVAKADRELFGGD